uniref:Uncharacterized protein n=1 Tax=Ditylenchus dipsaci TaxID=166011 RepID=A0A915EVB7_9BILA
MFLKLTLQLTMLLNSQGDKAKAKSIWIEEPQLATVDKIVFDQCAAEAKSAVSLAKCVVHLLKSRDALKEEKKKL